MWYIFGVCILYTEYYIKNLYHFRLKPIQSYSHNVSALVFYFWLFACARYAIQQHCCWMAEHVIHLTWMLTFVTYSIVLVREKQNPIYITEATTGVEKHFCFVLLCFSLFITQQNSFRFFLLKKRNTFFLRISFRGSSWLFFVPVFNELMNAWTRQLSFYSQITTAILWAFYVFGVVVVAVVFNILNQHDASHPYALFIDNVWSFIAYTYTHDYVPFFLLKFSFLSAFSSDFDCFMVSIRWRS